jgi:hypothetical protein
VVVESSQFVLPSSKYVLALHGSLRACEHVHIFRGCEIGRVKGAEMEILFVKSCLFNFVPRCGVHAGFFWMAVCAVAVPYVYWFVTTALICKNKKSARSTRPMVLSQTSRPAGFA